MNIIHYIQRPTCLSRAEFYLQLFINNVVRCAIRDSFHSEVYKISK